LHADCIEVKFVSLWVLLEESCLNKWLFHHRSAVTTCRRNVDVGMRFIHNADCSCDHSIP